MLWDKRSPLRTLLLFSPGVNNLIEQAQDIFCGGSLNNGQVVGTWPWSWPLRRCLGEGLLPLSLPPPGLEPPQVGPGPLWLGPDPALNPVGLPELGQPVVSLSGLDVRLDPGPFADASGSGGCNFWGTLEGVVANGSVVNVIAVKSVKVWWITHFFYFCLQGADSGG